MWAYRPRNYEKTTHAGGLEWKITCWEDPSGRPCLKKIWVEDFSIERSEWKTSLWEDPSGRFLHGKLRMKDSMGKFEWKTTPWEDLSGRLHGISEWKTAPREDLSGRLFHGKIRVKDSMGRSEWKTSSWEDSSGRLLIWEDLSEIPCLGKIRPNGRSKRAEDQIICSKNQSP